VKKISLFSNFKSTAWIGQLELEMSDLMAK